MAVETVTPGELSRLLMELVTGGPEPPASQVLHPGARVGRFHLLREIGRGGFGVVYEAEDVELGRRIAFKALRPGLRTGADSDSLLGREAAAVAQLQHPNVVTIHDLGRCDAGPYLVLELLRGETLSARLHRGRVSAHQAMRIADAVVAALVHAHARGVLHRDLKPANVFLVADGAIKVLDFGLAALFGAVGPRGGTPGHMAPEQLRGEGEDARTDLYSVGLLLGEMLRGHPPPLDGVQAWLREARAPSALVGLAARCLAHDPAGRPATAAALADELSRVREALSLPRPRAGGPAPGSAASLEALRHLFRGEECASRPAFGQECAEAYRKAVELDPTLAMAHYQLAIWARRFGGTAEDQRRAIAGAVRHLARVTPPERALIRALAAQLDGDDGAALGILREATERWSQDPRAWYEFADLLRHHDEFPAALACLGRAVELAPERGWGPGQLAEMLGALDRRDELRVWAERWERSPSPVTLHALAVASGWLGRVDGAVLAARRGVALGSGIVGQQDLIAALVAQRRYAEAEELARPLADPGSPVRRLGHYALAALAAYRGRFAEGLAHLDALARAVPAVERDAFFHAVRADYLAGAGDPGPVRDAAEALAEVDPSAAAELAPTLAWLGDLEGAARFAWRLRSDSPADRAHRALALGASGHLDAALGAFRLLETEAPIAIWRIAPLWFHADLAIRAGRHAEAIEVLERLERAYLPRMMWRSWARSRGLLLLHRCRLATGDAAGAEAALARVEAEIGGGEPDDPTVREVRRARAGQS